MEQTIAECMWGGKVGNGMPGWTARAYAVTILAASRGPERPMYKRDQYKAPVAQLDRVLPSEGRGRRFKSCRARQKHQRKRPLSRLLRWPFLVGLGFR